MARVARGFRRELSRFFQDRPVTVFANGRRFRGTLRLVGRDFVTLNGNGRTVVRIPRIIAVRRGR